MINTIFNGESVLFNFLCHEATELFNIQAGLVPSVHAADPGKVHPHLVNLGDTVAAAMGLA